MKKLFLLIMISFLAFPAIAQNASMKDAQPDSAKKIQIVEASCGQCQFHMAGKGCNLAVRMDGKAWFVDGTSIDDHGDAHSKDGFCEAIRKAKVQGEIVNNRFKATYFKLLEPEVKKDPKDKEKE